MFEAGSLIFRIQTVGAGLFKAELQQADEAAKKAAKSVSDAAKSTNELGKQSRETAPQVKSIRDELRTLSSEAQAASREVGGAMALIGAAIIATVALTVKAATDWESAWAGVRKTVDGTEEELAGVEAGLRSMSQVLPASHAEIAAVAEAAGQLGVSAENIVAFTRTMIDLGETTNLTSQEAATSLAQLMNVMQTAPSDVSKLGSAVVALGNAGASTERDIVQMAQRIAGAGQVIGLSEGDVLGLANALASVGIEAEAGGTAISSIMIDISRAVSTGGDSLIEWAKLAGMSGDEFAAKWKAEPAEALVTLVEGMGRLNARGGDVFAMLSRLGQSDVRVTRALLSLAGAGDLLAESLGTGNRAFAENTALQAEAAKRYETTAATVAMARNSIVDLAIDLGSHLLPAVKAGADAVNTIATGIGDLPEPVQGAIATLGVFTGLIVLTGGVALIALPKIIAFREAVTSLAASAPATTSALRGLAGFMAGPWGIALTVATIGLGFLSDHLKRSLDVSDEFQNSLVGNADAATALATALSSGRIAPDLEEAAAQLRDLDAALRDARRAWVEGGPRRDEFTPIIEGLRVYGDQLGKIAENDLPAAAAGFRLLANETDGSHEQLWALLSNMPAYRDALTAQATALGLNLSAMSDTERQSTLVAIAQEQATDRTQSAAAAYLEAADATQQMERDLDSLLSVLDEANGKNQDAISSNVDYERTLREAREQLELARQGVDGYGMGLDQATEAGARNVESLLEIAEASREAADGQFALDGNTDAYLQRLASGRQQIIDTAVAFGATADEAQALADKIYAMPDEKQIEVLASTSAAARLLDTFIAKYEGRRITMSMFLEATGSNRGAAADAARLTGQALNYINQADGGNVRFFGSGGEHHVAQFARAGDMRVWAEPETGGEWYIPDGEAKRPRSMMLAEQMLNGWGYTMVSLGDRGPATASGPVAVEVIVQPRGGIDLLEYIEVTAQAAAADSNNRVNHGARTVGRR